MNLVEELRWRGMLQDIVPGTEEQLNKEMTTGYIGFDPTADSLHIGSLVPIILLMHLQKSGHKPIALVGGATGLVGDPSGRSEERNMLSEETLHLNLQGIRKQLEKFLDFDRARKNCAEIVNNYEWFKNMNFLHFIRDAGKYITVNYMMSKDSVSKRINSETGMSFMEFSYQLVQGYDFYWLYEHMNCKLQMGGSDQWGNIVTGTELIRKKKGGEAFALTCPLITKADGGKFGKTEKGNVWLDPKKTSPYQFYQFWLNASDTDAEKWIKIFTFLSRDTIEILVNEHFMHPSSRVLQRTLAQELTIMVHGEDEYNKAVETTQKLFSNQNVVAENLSVEDLEGMEGVIKFDYTSERIEQGIDIVSFLAETGIFPSKGDARKTIKGGGVSLNRKKVEDEKMKVETSHLLHNKYILVQKGKKNYYLVEAK